MTHITSMLTTHPDAPEIDQEKLAACIAACFECAQACTACADACLAEEHVGHLRSCIRTNADCADVCGTTGRVLSRLTGQSDQVDTIRALVEACRASCASCAEECGSHAEMHEHCRICAEACRRCEQACADLLNVLA